MRPKSKPNDSPETAGIPSAVARLIRLRTENIYRTRQLLCTEAVLTVINQGLRGDLPADLAVRLASGLPEGLSGSGCLCGALNGGALAIGLFLGRSGPGIHNNRNVRQATRDLHERFRERYGSTCCRILTRQVVYGSSAHFDHCAGLTGTAAELAAGIILEHRPELARNADLDYLNRKDSLLGAGVRRFARAVTT